MASNKKNRATDDLLGELHSLTAKVMLDKLTSGEFSASDLSVIVKFLQNNQIVVDTSEAGSSAFDQLKKLSLPTFEDIEEDADLRGNQWN
jgi:hypothetical protein